ncbi:MAG: nucleotide sugar dehydrogenase, partial [Spirochaetaceae bacterium]|nr:nucleotide sugar dehydrogenase [Spirochaetaceae bacterium]
MDNCLKNVCIVGGCGHVGIPLGLALATKDFNVTLIDTNKSAVEKINNRNLPFKEEGAEKILSAHIQKNLIATTDVWKVKDNAVVIFVTGTPVDEHHNPEIKAVLNVILAYLEFMRKEQLIILRSTIFPGTT